MPNSMQQSDKAYLSFSKPIDLLQLSEPPESAYATAQKGCRIEAQQYDQASKQQTVRLCEQKASVAAGGAGQVSVAAPCAAGAGSLSRSRETPLRVPEKQRPRSRACRENGRACRCSATSSSREHVLTSAMLQYPFVQTSGICGVN